MKLFKSILVALFALFLTGFFANAQSPFGLYLQPTAIAGLPGIQSYAWGKHNGKWLIIGGRTDGLHRREASISFNVAGNNTNLIVVDPVAGTFWSAPLSSLPTTLQEQLSSTNIEFHQIDTMLYCIGGYGYSATAGDHVTYSNMIAINLPGAINAVISGTSLASFFRYQTHTQFAVTGGHLEQIYDTLYLIGGNKFDGRYNPMGGGSYTQVYTNQIRRFTLHDDGTTLTIHHLPGFTDATNLHRRDYNAAAQILPDGSEGVTAFSGVFQTTANIPYLSAVNVSDTGYQLNTTFSQYYNHYHCALLPVYSAGANQMHTVFFGGIAQYYDSAGVLTLDNNVPFVKTIARVTRDATGTMTEYKMPVDMPSFLGASAELIPADGLPTYPNHVLKLDDLVADTTLVGYIYGGISSTAANIFSINNGTQSSAYNQLIKVYIIKGATSVADAPNKQSTSKLKLQVYPNPNKGDININFATPTPTTATITVTDVAGTILSKIQIVHTLAGENAIILNLSNNCNEGTYLITVETPDAKSIQKIIIRH